MDLLVSHKVTERTETSLCACTSIDQCTHSFASSTHVCHLAVHHSTWPRFLNHPLDNHSPSRLFLHCNAWTGHSCMLASVVGPADVSVRDELSDRATIEVHMHDSPQMLPTRNHAHHTSLCSCASCPCTLVFILVAYTNPTTRHRARTHAGRWCVDRRRAREGWQNEPSSNGWHTFCRE